MTDRPNSRHFRDQVVIVTGAGSGIGLALSVALAESGALVLLVDVDGVSVDNAAAGLCAKGLNATARQADVTDRAAMEQVYLSMANRYGRLDFVFHNAGVGAGIPFDEASSEQWDRILALNLRAVVDGTSIAYRIMTAFGSGHIVNMASVSGLVPVPMQTLYNTTKFAVVGLSTTLRTEAAAAGIRVSVVCPGNVATPIWATPIIGQRAEVTSSRIPADALSPDEAARMILTGVSENRAIIIFPTTTARWLTWTYRHFPRYAHRRLVKGTARRAGKANRRTSW